MRKSHLIEAHVRAMLVHYKRVTLEGETLQFDSEELKITCSFQAEDDRALLHWPVSVLHKIDEESPFFDLGPRELLNARFELIVTLEGVVEPTGNSVQARSSYLPNEILWGYRYENMVSYSKRRGTYLIDCSNLNAVVEDDTPRMSRREFEDEVMAEVGEADEDEDGRGVRVSVDEVAKGEGAGVTIA